MEPNESQHHLSSYFTTTTTPATTSPSPTNGLLQPPHNTTPDSGGGGGGPHMVYPHSVGPSSAAVSTAPVEPPRRKRGRPRKYGTPEQALAAKKSASLNSLSKEKRETASSSSPSYSVSSRKSQQMVALGNAGQGFTPHVITVNAGEDVARKLRLFMQQSGRELCILSASGTIASAALCQPANSGGIIAYEGPFDIISLSGSFMRTDIGGRTGGLSVCLSNTNGHIVGGRIGGPLTAGGPVQVIVGTFVVDSKKDAGARVEASTSKLPSSVGGASVPNIGFRSPVESAGRNDHQTIGGNPFMIHSQGMHVAPSRSTDWNTRVNIGFDFTGRTGHGAHQSPENGDYEQLPD